MTTPPARPEPVDGPDVVVLGGGLAGLTLAIQLKQRDPSVQVTVLERRTHPAREAAFKVGESTVEIGAYYLADVLGLREHLDSEQIRKFGFRFFFFRRPQRHRPLHRTRRQQAVADAVVAA